MNRWKLYWVSSDGYEDCFVVAKNSRSAKCIEVKMNGFSDSEVSSTYIMDIPHSCAQKYEQEWPWYADYQLLIDLGARQRTIEDNVQQILLDGVVYSRDHDGKWTTYIIGFRAICERNPSLPHPDFSEEDIEDYHHYLYEMMGMAITNCHKIEWELSHSFLVAWTKRYKKDSETFGDAFDKLKTMTLGGIITSIRKSFDIDMDVNFLLSLFIDMRNQFIHGITHTERYDIEDNWGQRELLNFLDIFITLSEKIEKISAAFFEMGMKIIEQLTPNETIPQLGFDYNDDLLELFASFFKLKDN